MVSSIDRPESGSKKEKREESTEPSPENSCGDRREGKQREDEAHEGSLGVNQDVHRVHLSPSYAQGSGR
jgi:hypothetical protein